MMNNDNFFYEVLKNFYDDGICEKIYKGSVKKNNTFRINLNKTNLQDVISKLKEEDIKYKTFKFYDLILNCKNDELFTYDLDYLMKFINREEFNIDIFFIDDKNLKKIKNTDIYNDGLIYFQNISTLIPIFFLNLEHGDNILDMCAAPGGKSLFIQNVMKNKVNITAVELNHIRYERMCNNFQKQNANVFAIKDNSLNLDDNLKFDKILLDAPCSGSGTIDILDENVYTYFTEDLIKKSIVRQKKLLEKALKLLKRKGRLVYSTCSILNSENEEILSLFKKKLENIVQLKIFPNECFEGFYIFSGEKL